MTYPEPLAAGSGEFMIAMIPDTQNLVKTYPTYFVSQCNYTAQHAAALGIRILLQVGDLVDDVDAAGEWTNFNSGWAEIESENLPYLIGIGNHDYDTYATRDATTFNAAGNFPQTRYTGQSWWDGGFYEVDHSENAYQLMTIDGNDYIFITLEYTPRADVLAWANALLATYSTRSAVIITHEYLEVDGTRTVVGDAIWAALKANDNIILILCGHWYSTPMASRTDNSDGGKAVPQILVNFQGVSTYGWGMTRYITINPTAKTVKNQTYSNNGHTLIDTALGSFTLPYG